MPLPAYLTSSRGELEAASRNAARAVYYGDHRLLCRLLGEYPAFVDTRDRMLGPRLALDGYWEAWVTLALARYLQPGMWCVDVGANYGYYTLLMAAAVGAEGRVLACEPNPLLAENHLPWNVAVNGFADRMEVCSKAIGDRDDPAVELAIREGDSGTSSLARASDSPEAKTIPVPMTALDHLCADWPRLDLVKIDAEGAEALVWEGKQQTLKRFPHAAVLVELHLERAPPQSISFLHRLERSGYGLRFVNYDGDVVPIDSATIVANPQEHWMLWVTN